MCHCKVPIETWRWPNWSNWSSDMRAPVVASQRKGKVRKRRQRAEATLTDVTDRVRLSLKRRASTTTTTGQTTHPWLTAYQEKARKWSAQTASGHSIVPYKETADGADGHLERSKYQEHHFSSSLQVRLGSSLLHLSGGLKVEGAVQCCKCREAADTGRLGWFKVGTAPKLSAP